MENHHAGKGKYTPTELLDGADAIETVDYNLSCYTDFTNYYSSEFAARLGHISDYNCEFL
jgi:hypothetical protein